MSVTACHIAFVTAYPLAVRWFCLDVTGVTGVKHIFACACVGVCVRALTRAHNPTDTRDIRDGN